MPAGSDYRDYSGAPDRVRSFYRQQHAGQTLAFVERKRAEFLPLRRSKMTILEAVAFLNTLVDDSDPDLELDQRSHLLQTSEALRADGAEDWFVLAGFLHDLGKVLCLFGEPQWAVVGDTFPVGCAFSQQLVYPEFFADNPDSRDPHLGDRFGIYRQGIGLRRVTMSWGHDEYLFHVLDGRLPEPALYMIRYHSFYAWHREGDYDYLCDAHDREMLPWVRRFNRYDLYSKSPTPPDWNALEPYYAKLVSKYLPGSIAF